MKLALILVVLAIGAMADAPLPTRPSTKGDCDKAGLRWADYTLDYESAAGKGFATTICLFKYEDACPGLDQVSACNNYGTRCVSLNSRRFIKNMASPALGFNHKAYKDNTKQAMVCLASGVITQWSDANVLIIAQVIFSGIIFIIACVLVISAVGFSLATVVYLLLIVISILLVFSYYYLNAIIIVAAASAALGLFNAKDSRFVIGGQFLLLFALFWVTFRFGLGDVQHHSRLEAKSGNPEADYSETLCGRYYRGQFNYPMELMDDDHNDQKQFWGYCVREWVAAELFFMLFAELLLVLLTAAGIRFLAAPQKEQPAGISPSTQPINQGAPEGDQEMQPRA